MKYYFPKQIANYVPSASAPSPSDISRLSDYLYSSKKLLVITGAGVSTESGIPDYRSENVGLYATSKRRPVDISTFMSNERARQNYWIRNYRGWPFWSSVKPNINHLVLASWEKNNILPHGLITQNVDTLHYKGGSSKVIELHGSTARVHCTKCSFSIYRMAFQKILEDANPSLIFSESKEELKPDGDVEVSIAQEFIDEFNVPKCPRCFGILKPTVVFFGDNVDSKRVSLIETLVINSDTLFVIGSSLSTFSSFRILRQGAEMKKKIIILNIGATRADSLVDFKLCAKASDVLPLINFGT